ncbi:MAG: transcription termination factor Rho [Clostridiaceae bacterium]|jgi:transcription termination factor Rho|nr:transcription termination factor Rho [Clostridiaceae bacterium]
MSQIDFKGKTKQDLVTIAHLSNLLTPRDTSRMTKQQLVDFLTTVADEAEVNQAAEQVQEEIKQPAESSKAAKTKTAAKKKTARAAEAETVAEIEEIDTSDEKSADGQEEAAAAAESVSEKPKRSRKTTKSSPKRQKANKTDESEKTIQGNSRELLPLPLPENEETAIVEVETESMPGAAEDAAADEKETVTGILEIMPEGYGFLRVENYLQSNFDIYISPQFIRRFHLRTGDLVKGPARPQRDNERYRALSFIDTVNDMPPEQMKKRPVFDRLTPIYPNERFKLETDRSELSTRIIDLVSPIGKGQRGMIVSPPKAGKTMLLQKIANAIVQNNPEVKLMVLLIDERPEEVTDMQRSIEGEVAYSTFDRTPENHVKITELVLERAMRLVELGHDVVILLDSITRMGRAYNLTINPTGRTLSGGLDPGALYGPKRFFGAARNIEHGGSLTIIATALIDTGSRMDEVIFEEFKGTGNMEVILDRKLADKRIFPAIDIVKSSTRREELLLSERELDAVWSLRKAFGQLETTAVTETMISLLMKTRDNDQFISSINVSFSDRSLFEAMRGTSKGNGNSNGNSNRS